MVGDRGSRVKVVNQIPRRSRISLDPLCTSLVSIDEKFGVLLCAQCHEPRNRISLLFVHCFSRLGPVLRLPVSDVLSVVRGSRRWTGDRTVEVSERCFLGRSGLRLGRVSLPSPSGSTHSSEGVPVIVSSPSGIKLLGVLSQPFFCTTIDVHS